MGSYSFRADVLKARFHGLRRRMWRAGSRIAISEGIGGCKTRPSQSENLLSIPSTILPSFAVSLTGTFGEALCAHQGHYGVRVTDGKFIGPWRQHSGRQWNEKTTCTHRCARRPRTSRAGLVYIDMVFPVARLRASRASRACTESVPDTGKVDGQETTGKG